MLSYSQRLATRVALDNPFYKPGLFRADRFAGFVSSLLTRPTRLMDPLI